MLSYKDGIIYKKQKAIIKLLIQKLGGEVTFNRNDLRKVDLEGHLEESEVLATGDMSLKYVHYKR